MSDVALLQKSESKFVPASLNAPGDSQPIRGEILGLDHLAEHARRLAETLGPVKVEAGRPLLQAFQRNAKALHRARASVAEAVRLHEPLGADADWLLDNYHIVSETLAEIEVDLPGGYYTTLPKMMTGPLQGLPRPYIIALELTAHCDSSFDEANISRFVQGFQTVAPLQIGELWAIPIMLRLCLVENLRRLSEQILQDLAHRRSAHGWLTAHAPSLSPSTPGDRFELERIEASWRDCYMLHLLQGLRGSEANGEMLEACLKGMGHHTGEVLDREKRRQAANQVSIGNCVTSVRLLSALNWPRFFEQASHLEKLLRDDPAGAYGAQDFATRDRYRREVEALARGSRRSELEVAQVVLEKARSAPAEGNAAVARHIGYHLVDEGRPALEAELGYRAPWRHSLRRSWLRSPKAWYFGCLALAWLALVAGFAAGAFLLSGAVWVGVVAAILAALPLSEVAVGLMNFVTPRVLAPRTLPRLEFPDGVPGDCATFVVIPTLLSKPGSAASLVERLEIHYLANSEANLVFALLTDLTDAPHQVMPHDEATVQAALEGIRALNAKYASGGPDRFFLFHRGRRHNPAEGCWMGWERKRGKLAEFNHYLRTGSCESSMVLSAPLPTEPRIRFVITLDTDTQMPRETARRLISTLAHPLNLPRFDAAAKRVVRGYGLLQPRIELSLRGARKSLFARIFAGSTGLDPYTTAVSDTYQDLFGLGSFTGKGIYDLDAFEAAVSGAFPDNHILSHDLIEGNHARCGLVTEVEFLDDFPSHYQAYARREHRWARGDWQIAPWLLGSVPEASGARRANPLPLVERWKIFDNLRRSLVGPSLVAMLLAGWLAGPRVGLLASLVAFGVVAWPLLMQFVSLPGQWVRGRLGTAPLLPTAGQVLLSCAFLADHARGMLDAVVRTLGRLLFTRKRMLEWESAAATERRLQSSFLYFARTMATTILFAAAAAFVVAWLRRDSLNVAAPWLLAWLASPAIAWFVSRPHRDRHDKLARADAATLHRLARKTWGFFETFVGPADHWLPPDNYQEDPKGEIANRTSPTNIGLYLLSCVVAHEFGYVSGPKLLDRLEKALNTLDQLEREHGHFLNWYDTSTLQPLLPKYISTVDSGNLAVSLLAAKQGLFAQAREAILGPRAVRGLRETLDLLHEALHAWAGRGAPEAFNDIKDQVHTLRESTKHTLHTFGDWQLWLGQFSDLFQRVKAKVDPLDPLAAQDPAVAALRDWTARLDDLLHQRQAETDAMRRVLKDDQLLAKTTLESAADEATQQRLRTLTERLEAMAKEMDFRFLYNGERHLFAVGFNVSAGRLDSAHYDLLASEAALTSFYAIARGHATKKHWFHLGRPLTRVEGALCLLSWGGTMFEYLMPRLFLNAWPGTLLGESQHAAVVAQERYGRTCGTPWGISESAFSVTDGHLTYQYQAFGVPLLGLKRGLSKDLVVAPYATGLAVMTNPEDAVRNLRRLSQEGAEGPWGMYEALDYTADRLPPRSRAVIVKCYMAHHQAMLFLGLANGLHNDLVPRWFHAEPMIRATELLLQERVPAEVALAEPLAAETAYLPTDRDVPTSLTRRVTTPHTSQPRTHLLSSGRYSLLVSNAGAGQSWGDGLAVTRWRQDGVGEMFGQFLYLRDLRTQQRWSGAYLPVGVEPDEYEVLFSLDKAEFRRRDGKWETRLEITISPENHAEVRRLTVTNHDRKSHFVEVTSYAEMALAPQGADVAHPSFSKLFVETEYLPASEAIVCRRRPRGPEQQPVWALHVMAAEGRKIGAAQWETDRARFIGRGRSLADPVALDPSAPALSGTTGPVLDPIVSLRRQFRVKAGTSVTLTFATALADSREQALALADQYHDLQGVQRAFELAWAHSQVELRQLQITAIDAHLFQRLASFLVYPCAASRAGEAVLKSNRLGQSGLWRMGISGDWPIALIRVSHLDDLPVVRQVIAAHTFWRRRGLVADLVLLNENAEGYFEEIQEQLLGLVRSSDSRDLIDKPGGVFLRKSSHLAAEDRTLLLAAALLILHGNRGPLAGQLEAIEKSLPAALRPTAKKPVKATSTEAVEVKADPAGLFDNGVGSFTPDGAEYRMRVSANRLPPAPWINVVANPDFGFTISESGAGFTWAGNSQANRLTPWHNDPVSDPLTEVVYVRDEETGEFWSATPRPLGGDAEYVVRHGQGYSFFEHQRGDLAHTLAVFVPPQESVKVYHLRLQNRGRKPLQLSVAFFAEWTLGATRDRTAAHIVTREDGDTGALLATNAFNPDEPAQVAFADISLRPRTVTGDRREFLGRLGGVQKPLALQRGRLSGKVGAGLDPCAGLFAPLTIQPEHSADIVIVLGMGANVEEARRLTRLYRDLIGASAGLAASRRFWDQTLSAVTIETPDAALNMLMNRWLLYQVLSCRMWGRSALYQSGGAYGYRDQLQDAMALVATRPQDTRNQLLRAASRQFVEGDVQHWWHPPGGAGVRTRFSDDYLWLPFAVHQYVTAVGDFGVLDETAPYLTAPLLRPGQDEDYRLPDVAAETGTLYDHCLRALQHAMRFGVHGLPLMGTGDWNDGMNRVGIEGKGESVWTGWFLLVILRRFADLCKHRGDDDRADGFRKEADRLAAALEANAWDGGWYRRAYFDDGRPLGSRLNDVCQIDSLPQSWAVLAGGDPRRARQGMDAVDRRLVRRDEQIILLFTPPFDHTELEPGYIKGYPPGIRENGGQYTHAALWVAQAWAQLGEADKALEAIQILNPVNHARTPDEVERYRLEPYVVAADVYSQPPHVGRGGWSWYTGSAGWFHRVVLEDLLGFTQHGDHFQLRPCLPAAWPGYALTVKRGAATWRIEVRRAEKASATYDDQPWSAERFPYHDDGRSHRVVVEVAAKSP